jgi:hypothetical protein
MPTESFVFHGYLDDLTLCDKIIEYHKNGEKKKGETIVEGVVCIDKDIKESTDVVFPFSELSNSYVTSLQKILDKYGEKWPSCNFYGKYRIIESINIQHYAPSEGYKRWHTERTDSAEPGCLRHLVFMTYLNDVTDKGETEFLNQGLSVQPRKGLTLIWPADWTHTHRGVPSPTQDKYIVTGWFSFYN